MHHYKIATVYLALLAILASISSTKADLLQVEVHGLPDKMGKSDQKGFSVVLVDVGDPDLIHGILTVPDSFGDIEAAVLMIYDGTGKKIGRVMIASRVIAPGEKVFEFELARDLLQNSYIGVSHRDKDDLHVAKVILGAFSVIDKRKHP